MQFGAAYRYVAEIGAPTGALLRCLDYGIACSARQIARQEHDYASESAARKIGAFTGYHRSIGTTMKSHGQLSPAGWREARHTRNTPSMSGPGMTGWNPFPSLHFRPFEGAAMRSAIRSFHLLLALCGALGGATTAYAQCGYGTSQQDCSHQQRDAHGQQMNDMARQQPQAQQGGYQGGQTASSGPVPHRWVEALAATAVHPDAKDVWAVWDARGSMDQAYQLALDACTREMGSGCAKGAGVAGGSIAVARDEYGFVWTMYGETPEKAGQAVQAECAKQNQQCRVQRTITTRHWEEVATSYIFDRTQTRFPARRDVLGRVAAIAWPKQAPTNGNLAPRTWLISGIEGSAPAFQRVLDNCRRETGVECAVARHVVGAHLVAYRNSRGVVSWIGALERGNANALVRSSCTQQGESCKVVAIYDADRPTEQVIDEAGL